MLVLVYSLKGIVSNSLIGRNRRNGIGLEIGIDLKWFGMVIRGFSNVLN